jgi:precorrin-3B C17-methyltransferase
MTPQALAALRACDVVVGYDLYVELIREHCRGKEVLHTGMTREVERCRMALAAALAGKHVALVCSGDAGVYGMSGLMLEVAREHPQVRVDIVPGVTAACSAAALLGAPLMHDFAVVSLSDRLTPWPDIARKLRLAAAADFVLCLYNPRSGKRQGHLEAAVDILLECRAPDTPCGFARQVGRAGECARVCPLAELPAQDIDMFATVFVGNSQTRVINGRLVTPRGYGERNFR